MLAARSALGCVRRCTTRERSWGCRCGTSVARPLTLLAVGPFIPLLTNPALDPIPAAGATGIPLALHCPPATRRLPVAERFELHSNAPAETAAREEPAVQGQELRDLSPLDPLSSEVLDRDALRASVGGDPGALLDLVTRFLGESQAILEGLRHGITRGDSPALEQGARRLTGALREVAATAARAAALHLEAAARVGDLAKAADVMFTLENEIARLEPQLTSLQNDR